MKVFLTRRAERNYNSIKEYIAKEWGQRTAEAFVNKADETFHLLESFPKMGSVESKDVRGFQLSKQTRILYRVKEQRIIILSFFDVRQDPNKKPG
jgi:plasmid stabilization system protein ParE